ncbi:unnamed protein product [Aphanomyces euteiches]
MLAVFTSRDLVEAIVQFQDGLFGDLKPHFSRNQSTMAVLHHAIANNYIPLVQRLLACRPHLMTSQAVELAAAFGHLALVTYLHGQIPPSITSSAIDCAARNGHLEVVAYLHSRGMEVCTVHALDAAIRGNHLNVARFLLTHRKEGCSSMMVNMAAAAGQLEMIKLLHEHDAPGFSTQTMDMAASAGHLSIVTFLNDHRTEGCSVDAMNDAARRGFSKLVCYLHQQGKTCTTDAMDDAAVNGHLDIVRFLHMYRHEGCTTDAIDLAARNGHLEVVKYLTFHRFEGSTDNAMNDAAAYGHDRIVAFLKQHWMARSNYERAATNLDQHGRVKRFRVRGKFDPADETSFLRAFFESPEVRAELPFPSSMPPSIESMSFRKLKTSVLSMAFFEKLEDNPQIVSKSGYIRKCYDDVYNDCTVSDCLRDMVVNPDSEHASLFSSAEQDEAVFQIFKRLVIGGAMSQPDDNLEPYLSMTKQVYKALVSVRKEADSKALQVYSPVYIFTDDDSSNQPQFFPTSSPFNACFLAVDPKKHAVLCWYAPFVPFW